MNTDEYAVTNRPKLSVSAALMSWGRLFLTVQTQLMLRLNCQTCYRSSSPTSFGPILITVTTRHCFTFYSKHKIYLLQYSYRNPDHHRLLMRCLADCLYADPIITLCHLSTARYVFSIVSYVPCETVPGSRLVHDYPCARYCYAFIDVFYM